MSRCSPFPPLGYVWKGVCGEALVGLMIKVKKEWAAAEKRRKKERRRQRKKEKRKIKKKELSSDKRHWGGWNIIDWIRSDHQKKREYKPQMLEKVSLIEELEQHIASGGLGYSLYNSKDVNRRKLCACHKPFDGNIIRTEFLPQKHTDPEVQSTSNRMEKFEMDATPAKVHIFPTSGLSKAVGKGMDPTPGWMLCHSAYQRATNDGDTETAPITRTPENDSLEIESQLRELLENWVPDPQLSEHSDFDDQEWLFQTRSDQRNTTERSKPIDEDVHYGSSNLYPHARYLPEADLIALPFTIIF